jgi:SAM-dependent methyltransferase
MPTTTPTTTPWATGTPTRSPFAFPAGPRGWLAARLMLWLNRPDELLDLLDVRAGQRVLEVGYGPGGLIDRLVSTPADRICGVDPSPQMRALATRRHRAGVAAGRIDLRLGTAEGTGYPDDEFDRVVSVRTVAIWPDLAAGVRELHRVTRPGGRLVIAWHGGAHPSRVARRLALPADKLDRIDHELGAVCGTVTRHELDSLTVFTALT